MGESKTKIDVAFFPSAINRDDIADTVCIVLDIFRATTSIVTAIANGCKAIIPVLSIEEAQKLAAAIRPVLIAGERQSLKLPGCDFGNSPLEFSPEKVHDQTIIMTTNNGTIAIKAAERAYRTFIGSFINAGAVCCQAKQFGKDILIVCAGTCGLFSLEDALCAGLLVRQLKEEAQKETILTDSAYGALLAYNQAQGSIKEAAVVSRNGKRLYDLGYIHDAEYCLQSDVLDIVPEYRQGRIVPFKEQEST